MACTTTSRISRRIFRPIKRLKENVEISLSLDASALTGKHQTELKALSRISYLGLTFRHQHQPEHHNEDLKTMESISTMIHRNPGLRSFSLAADYANNYRPENSTKLRNLPFLTPGSFKNLRELHLEGHLIFETADWAIWDNCVDWAQLCSLALVEIPLITEVLRHLIYSLPSLRTLRLSAYRIMTDSYERVHLLDPYPCSIVKDFLLAVPLEELDLIGFTREIPIYDVVRGSKKRLRKLRIHFDAELTPWRPNMPDPRPNLQLGETVFLDVEKMEYLLESCPLLECIGLDIEAQNDTLMPQPIRDALCSGSKLRYLQVYYHRPRHPFHSHRPSNQDIVNLFEDLRRAKRGVPLECLTFQYTWAEPWLLVWELGDKVQLTSRHNSVRHRYEEIWKDGQLLERRDPWPSYKKDPAWFDERPPWVFPDQL
ncbi:MAG: hypothetical protein Q9225_006983 [Loekoesia sp. 1 TL-2023]